MVLRKDAIGKLRHVVSVHCHLGEGPVWDAKNNYLYWVDLFRNRMHRWCPLVPDAFDTINFDHMVSAIGLRKDGLILATSDGVAYANSDGNIEAWRYFPVLLQEGAHSNDGAVDRQGRFWLGTAAGKFPENHLYRLDSQSIQIMESHIGISNGIGWSPDDRLMYYVDSPKQVIYVYDFDKSTGDIANRRIFVNVPKSMGAPDGITVDRDGYIWCAIWDGWRVVRYSPDGHVDTEIRVPVQRPTSCTFGGKHLNTLYITSASTGLSARQRNQQPFAGDVFAIDLPVSGIGESYFLG
ncbi:MAG: SMP-30/gluconolactonase/LRE family protein [Aggregatilineales bacterium]